MRRLVSGDQICSVADTSLGSAAMFSFRDPDGNCLLIIQGA
jgi:hypothetical protein